MMKGKELAIADRNFNIKIWPQLAIQFFREFVAG